MQAFTLFLVDDDIEDQIIFREALKSLKTPFDCLTARDGIFALDMMDDPGFQQPDIIFLDLNMPRMNGRELLKTIRQRDQYRDIPVIMYSTSSSPDDIKQCLALGANQYVTKHGSFQHLCQDLRKLIFDHLSWLRPTP